MDGRMDVEPELLECELRGCIKSVFELGKKGLVFLRACVLSSEFK
jgi:hypothetical protein